MRIYLGLLATILSTLSTATQGSGESCQSGTYGSDYRGNASVTVSGKTCQAWNVNKPHKPNRVISSMVPRRQNGMGEHNYCRNPDVNDPGVWCYTTDSATRWELCDVPHCPEVRNDDCQSGKNGIDYRGNLSVTTSGKSCQPWNSTQPHNPNSDIANMVPRRENGLGGHNYCRNPDKSDPGVWCYTSDPTKRWELCDIRHCNDSVPSIRLGLLGNQLGLSPTADQSQGSQSSGSHSSGSQSGGSQSSGSQSSGSQSNGAQSSGSQSSGSQSEGSQSAGISPHSGSQREQQSGSLELYEDDQEQCCCVPETQECEDDYEFEYGVGIIDIRKVNKSTTQTRISNVEPSQIMTRIVNRPGAQVNTNNQLNSECPARHYKCCKTVGGGGIDLSVFGRSSCIEPNSSVPQWTQLGCRDLNLPSGNNEVCGTRNYITATGLQHGETSPGEFPWTCLILSHQNDFVGSCVLVPNDSSNLNIGGTTKVLTAAHKLKKKDGPLWTASDLKIRVGEYDATGFNQLTEEFPHEEYDVTQIIRHPDFGPSRLDYDIAIMHTATRINMEKPTVNTACLPGCKDQFAWRFENGTGTRCWVAGFGKDEFNGTFQVVQRKVDLPLVEDSICNQALKQGLDTQYPGRNYGRNFQLSPSELCAGGEVGKDACTGDGGSPLVCQSELGRWTVVGLVTWGVGCASNIPGVYARLSHFENWINTN